MKNIFVEPDGDPEHFHYTCYVKLNEAIIGDKVGKNYSPKNTSHHQIQIVHLRSIAIQVAPLAADP